MHSDLQLPWAPQVVRGVSPDDDHLDHDDLAVRLPQFHRPVIPAP
jgi:hypothetical protein